MVLFNIFKDIYMKFKTLLALFLALILSIASAEGFNDNYIQIGYTSNNYKFDDNTRTLSGSKELDNGLLVLGSYSYMTADWDDPGEHEEKTVKTISVGIGKVFNLNFETDFVSSLTYSDYDSKQVCTNTDGSDCTSSYSDGGIFKSDYYTVNLGARHLISPDFQVNAEYSLDMKGGLDPKTKTISVGAMKDVTENIAIGLKVSSYKKPDANETEIYIRRSF